MQRAITGPALSLPPPCDLTISGGANRGGGGTTSRDCSRYTTMTDLFRLFVAACLVLVLHHTLDTTHPAKIAVMVARRSKRSRRQDSDVACYSISPHSGDVATAQ